MSKLIYSNNEIKKDIEKQRKQMRIRSRKCTNHSNNHKSAFGW